MPRVEPRPAKRLGPFETTDHIHRTVRQRNGRRISTQFLLVRIANRQLMLGSPKLNPVERLWAFLKSHYLSNRVYDHYDHLFQACGQAWSQLVPEQLCSICHTEWIPCTN
jgi:hypothetical protein